MESFLRKFWEKVRWLGIAFLVSGILLLGNLRGSISGRGHFFFHFGIGMAAFGLLIVVIAKAANGEFLSDNNKDGDG